MVLLDLFCGAGGCATGYAQAGFEIIGIDVHPKRFPFEFHQMDWRDGLEEFGGRADVIHASPPCQAYSRSLGHFTSGYPELVPDVREALTGTGKPYIIENVIGAPLKNPIMLCGTMFGLDVRRHRLFETSFPAEVPMKCNHDGLSVNPYRASTRQKLRETGITNITRAFLEAMEVPWMREREGREAIPPKYTRYLGGLVPA